MLKMNTRKKHYFAFSRKKVNNGTYDHTLAGLLSKLFSQDIHYGSERNVDEEQLKFINRNEEDVFEYETVEVDLYKGLYGNPWSNVIYNQRIDSNNRWSTEVFYSVCNDVLTKHDYPEILMMYNTKGIISSTGMLSREVDKKRKFITYVILKDSVKYVPCEEHPECALKEGYKLRMFNKMYAPSIEAGLDSVGLKKYDYSDLAELVDGGNNIKLSLRVEEKFRNELFNTLVELEDEILDKMFGGKFRQILEANRMNVDVAFKDIVERLKAECGQLSLNIPTEDIL